MSPNHFSAQTSIAEANHVSLRETKNTDTSQRKGIWPKDVENTLLGVSMKAFQERETRMTAEETKRAPSDKKNYSRSMSATERGASSTTASSTTASTSVVSWISKKVRKLIETPIVRLAATYGDASHMVQMPVLSVCMDRPLNRIIGRRNVNTQKRLSSNPGRMHPVATGSSEEEVPGAGMTSCEWSGSEALPSVDPPSQAEPVPSQNRHRRRRSSLSSLGNITNSKGAARRTSVISSNSPIPFRAGVETTSKAESGLIVVTSYNVSRFTMEGARSYEYCPVPLIVASHRCRIVALGRCLALATKDSKIEVYICVEPRLQHTKTLSIDQGHITDIASYGRIPPFVDILLAGTSRGEVVAWLAPSWQFVGCLHRHSQMFVGVSCLRVFMCTNSEDQDTRALLCVGYDDGSLSVMEITCISTILREAQFSNNKESYGNRILRDAKGYSCTTATSMRLEATSPSVDVGSTRRENDFSFVSQTTSSHWNLPAPLTISLKGFLQNEKRTAKDEATLGPVVEMEVLLPCLELVVLHKLRDTNSTGSTLVSLIQLQLAERPSAMRSSLPELSPSVFSESFDENTSLISNEELQWMHHTQTRSAGHPVPKISHLTSFCGETLTNKEAITTMLAVPTWDSTNRRSWLLLGGSHGNVTLGKFDKDARTSRFEWARIQCFRRENKNAHCRVTCLYVEPELDTCFVGDGSGLVSSLRIPFKQLVEDGKFSCTALDNAVTEESTSPRSYQRCDAANKDGNRHAGALTANREPNCIPPHQSKPRERVECCEPVSISEDRLP